MVICAAFCGVWLVLAARSLRAKPAPSRLLQALLVICGVPLLGVVTYQHGPFIGLIALAVATVMLGLHYLPRLTGANSQDRS